MLEGRRDVTWWCRPPDPARASGASAGVTFVRPHPEMDTMSQRPYSLEERAGIEIQSSPTGVDRISVDQQFSGLVQAEEGGKGAGEFHGSKWEQRILRQCTGRRNEWQRSDRNTLPVVQCCTSLITLWYAFPRIVAHRGTAVHRNQS